MRVSGRSPDGKFVEIAELPSHPWYVAVQFHPEFQSRPLRPHPLFASFVEAAHRAQDRAARGRRCSHRNAARLIVTPTYVRSGVARARDRRRHAAGT